MVPNVARETSDKVPPGVADFDGTTRAGTLKALLDKHNAPPTPKWYHIKSLLAGRRVVAE